MWYISRSFLMQYYQFPSSPKTTTIPIPDMVLFSPNEWTHGHCLCTIIMQSHDLVTTVREQLFGNNCLGTTVREQLFGNNCSGTTVREQLFGNNCSVTTVQEQLFGNNCSGTIVREQLFGNNCSVTTVREQLFPPCSKIRCVDSEGA